MFHLVIKLLNSEQTWWIFINTDNEVPQYRLQFKFNFGTHKPTAVLSIITSNDCNSKSETGSKNLGELYYTAVQFS